MSLDRQSSGNLPRAESRPLVIGSRSWLFADTPGGANARANLYSLLQACEPNGVDGYWYLRKLPIAVPKASSADDFETLLPWLIGTVAN